MTRIGVLMLNGYSSFRKGYSWVKQEAIASRLLWSFLKCVIYVFLLAWKSSSIDSQSIKNGL